MGIESPLKGRTPLLANPQMASPAASGGFNVQDAYNNFMASQQGGAKQSGGIDLNAAYAAMKAGQQAGPTTFQGTPLTQPNVMESSRNDYENTNRAQADYHSGLLANPNGLYGADSFTNNEAKTSDKTPDLYGLAGIDNKQVYNDQDRAAYVLAQIKKYDPDAKIVDQSSTYGESGGGNTEYRIDFDESKIPKAPKGASNFGNGGLINENLIKYDPHYGAITPQYNGKADPFSAFGTIAPMIPMLFASIMTGGAAAGFIPTMMNSMPRVAATLSNSHLSGGQRAQGAARTIAPMLARNFLTGG